MEPIVYMLIGAGGVGATVMLWRGTAALRARVEAKAQAAASKAESDFKAKVAQAVGDVPTRLASLEKLVGEKIAADIAALKQKVGIS